MSNGDDRIPSLTTHIIHLDTTQDPEIAGHLERLLGAILPNGPAEGLGDGEVDDMPPLEQLDTLQPPDLMVPSQVDMMPTLLPVSEPPAQSHFNIHTAAQEDNDDDDASMPDLQSVSNSSDNEMDGVIEDDGDDAWEDLNEGLRADDGPPPLESIPMTMRSSERRARGDEDEDEDESGRPTRRRRRSGEPASSGPSTFMNIPPAQPTVPSQPEHTHPPHPFPFLGNPAQFLNALPRMFNPGNVGLNAHTHNHGHHRPPPPPPPQPGANPGPPPSAQAGPFTAPPDSFGFAVAFDALGNPLASFPIGNGPFPPGPGVPPGGAPNPPQPSGDEAGAVPDDNMVNNFIRLLGNMFGAGMMRMEEKDDPERAQKLVDGLDAVPVGLVRRMERVFGAQADTNESEAPGCAVCWDSLLDTEGEGFAAPVATGATQSATDPTEPAAMPVLSEPVPTAQQVPGIESSDEQPAGKKYPVIIALPCSHVFHASCLLPWFSRPKHQTCPTCRFNIDPENLTWTPPQPVPTTTQAPPPAPTRPGEATGAAPAVGAAHQGAAPPILPANAGTIRPDPTDANQPGADSVPDVPPVAQTQGLPDMGFTLDINFVLEPMGTAGAPQTNGPPPGPRGLPGFGIAGGTMSLAQFQEMMQGFVPGGGPTTPVPGAVPTGADRVPSPAAMGTPIPNAGFGAGAPPFRPMFFGPPPPGMAPNGAHSAAAGPPPPMGLPPWLNLPMFPPFGGPGGFRTAAGEVPHQQPRTPRERQQWAPPPAPGPTVRQRVEKRERELSLRCWSASCGIGPSDEEPFPDVSPTALTQVSLRRTPKEGDPDDASPVCEHVFHPACLVMAERVAGWDGKALDGAHVPVACPTCRISGCVQKQEWAEGVAALA